MDLLLLWFINMITNPLSVILVIYFFKPNWLEKIFSRIILIRKVISDSKITVEQSQERIIEVIGLIQNLSKGIALWESKSTIERTQRTSEIEGSREMINAAINSTSKTGHQIEQNINEIVKITEEYRTRVVQVIEQKLSSMPELREDRSLIIAIHETLQNQSKELGLLRKIISSDIAINLGALRDQQNALTKSIRLSIKNQSDHELSMIIFGDEVTRVPDIVSKNLSAILNLLKRSDDVTRDGILQTFREKAKNMPSGSIEESKIRELVDILLDFIAPEVVDMLSNSLKTKLNEKHQYLKTVEDLVSPNILGVYDDVKKTISNSKFRDSVDSKLDNILGKLNTNLKFELRSTVYDELDKIISAIIQHQRDTIDSLIEAKKRAVLSLDPALVRVKKAFMNALIKEMAKQPMDPFLENEFALLNKWFNANGINDFDVHV